MQIRVHSVSVFHCVSKSVSIEESFYAYLTLSDQTFRIIYRNKLFKKGMYLHGGASLFALLSTFHFKALRIASHSSTAY